MQIKGVGNNQIGNSYQNPNRMPNSTAGKKEDDVNKRLEALGVKVELSFQQTGAQQQEQENVRETTETQNPQATFSVLGWIKKIWDVGIAWLKSIWNDGQPEKDEEIDLASRETVDGEADAMQIEMSGEDAGEIFESDVELVAETPIDEDADYAAMYSKTGEAEMQMDNEDKFRTVGTPLHTSGMQDSYNRYGQHSKLGVEPANNMTIRK